MREIYAAARDRKAFYCASKPKSRVQSPPRDNEASLYRFSRAMASGQRFKQLQSVLLPILNCAPRLCATNKNQQAEVPIMPVDEARLNAFMEKFVHDIGAVMHAATVVVGDELGCTRRWPKSR
jgi:hypothetical protein